LELKGVEKMAGHGTCNWRSKIVKINADFVGRLDRRLQKAVPKKPAYDPAKAKIDYNPERNVLSVRIPSEFPEKPPVLVSLMVPKGQVLFFEPGTCKTFWMPVGSKPQKSGCVMIWQPGKK